MGKEVPHPWELRREYIQSKENAEDLKMLYNHPNRWLKGTGSDDFKQGMLDLWKAMSSASNGVLRGLAASLQLDLNTFTRLHSKDDSTMELKLYPPKLLKASPISVKRPSYSPSASMENNVDNDGKIVRVKTHSDLSSVTLLLQNDVDGLQILSSDGSWIDAPKIPGSVLVNCGEVMTMWTGRSYKSTKHRVIWTSKNETEKRYSIVFFKMPDAHAPIGHIQSSTSSQQFGDIMPLT
eukprot:TRINITY_DN9372_c0_g1_i1.p1 TRINITY_DN9372_c0_g1~~TRINITY_DN9372_c0_g1_i1.p1  ORF type:complete len:237 (-),score=49.25 TRINITY_DN9372_c0_g1_i1:39-749(-)